MNIRSWRAGSRVFVRGRHWRIASAAAGEDCEALRLVGVGGSDPGGTLTILVPFDRPIPQQSLRIPRVVRPRRWLHELDRVVAQLRPFGALSATAPAAIRLMPYQLEPAIAVLRGGATRVLIADAVGLGKTIQAGVLLAELHALDDAFRGLALVPAGLREQWSNELRTHFDLAAVIADAAWLRNTIAERPWNVNPWSLPGIYVASHDFVKRAEALRPLEDVTWDLVIVDEAHHATTGTDRRAAIDAIASRSVRVVLLTATPPGEPSAFESLCRIGHSVSSVDRPIVFARARTDVDPASSRRSTVLAVTPSTNEMRMHALLARYSAEVWKEAAARKDEGARLASIVLRKRALSSAGSLAASVERRMLLLVSPAAEQMMLPLDDEDSLDDEVRTDVLAAPGLADGRREQRWLSAIADAARTAARAESKMAYLVRLLRRLQEPVIVFTEYRDTLLRIHRRLSPTGRSIVLLHGGMDPAERSRIPQAFADGALTLLATDAAAEGLNLHHHCRVVIHYELPWNPSRLEQRAGRVDRIGQTRRVHEIGLVSASTAERLVIAPLTIRAARSRRLTGGAGLLGVLTESRVAEAVMAGGNNTEVPGLSAPALHADPGETRFRADAMSEVERLKHVRLLVARSSTTSRQVCERHAAPFVTATSVRRSAERLDSGGQRVLALLYSITVEADDARHVHEEIVVLGVPPVAEVSFPLDCATMRALVERYVTPSGSITSEIEAAVRRTLERVEAAETLRRQRLDDRRRQVHQIRWSEAQRLVQPDLFRRRREPALDATPPVAWPIPDRSPLRARTTLVAAVLIERYRGLAS